MDPENSTSTGMGDRLRCPHPPDRILMGNDRMEMVCSLCGRVMPFEPERCRELEAAETTSHRRVADE